VRSAEGAAFLARLLPYRTADNAIRGVVLTFTDITKRVEAEATARVERELAQRVVDTVRDPLLVLDGTLKVVSASRAFHATFSTTPEAVLGRHIYELADRRWDLPALRDLLEQILPRDRSFEGFEVVETAPDGTKTKRRIDGQQIGGGGGGPGLILLSFEH